MTDARVAAAYEDAAKLISLTCDLVDAAGYSAFADRVREIVHGIQSRTPADAQAALDRMLAKAREDALREAAEKAGQTAVDILLRHEPDASTLKQQSARQAARTPILALIEKHAPPKAKKPNLVGTGVQVGLLKKNPGS